MPHPLWSAALLDVPFRRCKRGICGNTVTDGIARTASPAPPGAKLSDSGRIVMGMVMNNASKHLSMLIVFVHHVSYIFQKTLLAPCMLWVADTWRRGQHEPPASAAWPWKPLHELCVPFLPPSVTMQANLLPSCPPPPPSLSTPPPFPASVLACPFCCCDFSRLLKGCGMEAWSSRPFQHPCVQADKPSATVQAVLLTPQQTHPPPPPPAPPPPPPRGYRLSPQQCH